LSALPRLAPWLFRYWQNSTPERVKRSARALAPLMEKCVDEHDALIAEAGPSAQSVVHHRGWLNCFRTPESFNQGIADANRLDEYGVDYAVLSAAQLRDLELHVSELIVGAILFRGSPSSSDPGMLTKAYADLFTRKGGRFIRGRCAQPSLGTLWLECHNRGRVNCDPRGGRGARALVRRYLSAAWL
jgi:D-amino-acid dehydrogenase